MRVTAARASDAGGADGRGVGAGVAAAFPGGVGVGVAAGCSATPFCAAGVGDAFVASGAGLESVHAPSAHASASSPSVFSSLLIFIRRILLRLKRRRKPDREGG